jgi:hypothetical protein
MSKYSAIPHEEFLQRFARCRRTQSAILWLSLACTAVAWIAAWRVGTATSYGAAAGASIAIFILYLKGELAAVDTHGLWCHTCKHNLSLKSEARFVESLGTCVCGHVITTKALGLRQQEQEREQAERCAANEGELRKLQDQFRNLTQGK